MGDFLKQSRHGTVFYFRRRVPDSIRSLVGKPYLVKTLGTCKRREAIILARVFAARTDSLFHHLKTMPENNDTLQILMLEWKQKHDLLNLRDEFEEKLEAAEHAHNAELDALRVKAREIALRTHVLGLKQAMVTGTAPQPAIGMPFSLAMEEYLDVQKKGTTRRTYGGRLKIAQEFFGAEKDIRHIEQADFSKYAAYANKAIANPTTAGFHITTLIGMLNHFRITQGWGAKLTSERLVEKKETPDSDDRDAFTLEQVRAIFENAKKYRCKHPHKFWATVAIQFLGCRIEELAQINLHTDFLQNQVAGIWYLKLTGKAEADGSRQRSLKNKQSWRDIPIHSMLVELGFVDFLIGQREMGFSRPFESGWKPYIPRDNPEPKWSHYITNWGGRELKRLITDGVITDPEKKLGYFHSMRHTFSGCLGRAKGVSIEASEAAMGHAYGGRERERYAKLKKDPVMLSEECIQPGLGEIVALVKFLT